MRIFWTIVIIIVIVVGIILVNKNARNDTLNMENNTNTESVNEGTSIDSSIVMSTDGSTSPEAIFTVNGGSFYFKPDIIKVKEGDTVTITFVNDGGFHDFRIDEFGLATTILEETGAQEQVTFVADKKGSFEYYCSIGTHRQMGMKGTLIVE